MRADLRCRRGEDGCGSTRGTCFATKTRGEAGRTDDGAHQHVSASPMADDLAAVENRVQIVLIVRTRKPIPVSSKAHPDGLDPSLLCRMPASRARRPDTRRSPPWRRSRRRRSTIPQDVRLLLCGAFHVAPDGADPILGPLHGRNERGASTPSASAYAVVHRWVLRPHRCS
jgi:hypothetical protein